MTDANLRAEHNPLIQKAKMVILSEIRKAVPGTRTLTITVEEDGQNVAYFRRALELAEVCRELQLRRLQIELRTINPIRQAKKHILNVLKNAHSEIREIVYPCLSKDVDVFYKALALTDVKAEFERRGVTPKVHVTDRRTKPEILVAPYESLTDGKLDQYLRDTHGI